MSRRTAPKTERRLTRKRKGAVTAAADTPKSDQDARLTLYAFAAILLLAAPRAALLRKAGSVAVFIDCAPSAPTYKREPPIPLQKMGLHRTRGRFNALSAVNEWDYLAGRTAATGEIR